jgi:hypothetical protein
MKLLALILCWLLCSVLAAGILFAYEQKEWPARAKKEYRCDLGWAVLISLLGGPLILVIAFFMTGFAKHGWKLR